MAKDNRPVTLVVESAGTCPLIKVGEGFSLRGNDLTNPRGGKMCVRAVCAVFAEVDAILSKLSPNTPLPSELIRCNFEGCGAAFRMQEPNIKEQSGMFTAPFMRRKADRAFLDVADRNAKPQPFLMRLSLDLRDELHFIGKPLKYEDGQPILHQGIDVQQFFILTHGMAGVVTRREGVETLIGSVGEGDRIIAAHSAQ